MNSYLKVALGLIGVTLVLASCYLVIRSQSKHVEHVHADHNKCNLQVLSSLAFLTAFVCAYAVQDIHIATHALAVIPTPKRATSQPGSVTPQVTSKPRIPIPKGYIPQPSPVRPQVTGVSSVPIPKRDMSQSSYVPPQGVSRPSMSSGIHELNPVLANSVVRPVIAYPGSSSRQPRTDVLTNATSAVAQSGLPSSIPAVRTHSPVLNDPAIAAAHSNRATIPFLTGAAASSSSDRPLSQPAASSTYYPNANPHRTNMLVCVNKGFDDRGVRPVFLNPRTFSKNKQTTWNMLAGIGGIIDEAIPRWIKHYIPDPLTCLTEGAFCCNQRHQLEMRLRSHSVPGPSSHNTWSTAISYHAPRGTRHSYVIIPLALNKNNLNQSNCAIRQVISPEELARLNQALGQYLKSDSYARGSPLQITVNGYIKIYKRSESETVELIRSSYGNDRASEFENLDLSEFEGVQACEFASYPVQFCLNICQIRQVQIQYDKRSPGRIDSRLGIEVFVNGSAIRGFRQILKEIPECCNEPMVMRAHIAFDIDGSFQDLPPSSACANAWVVMQFISNPELAAPIIDRPMDDLPVVLFSFDRDEVAYHKALPEFRSYLTELLNGCKPMSSPSFQGWVSRKSTIGFRDSGGTKIRCSPYSITTDLSGQTSLTKLEPAASQFVLGRELFNISSPNNREDFLFTTKLLQQLDHLLT